MTRLGLGKSYRHILTVRGRRTGLPRSTPVDVMAEGHRRWLVAGYGMTNWVKNLRVSGEAELQRGRRHESVSVREIPPEEAVPVLRRYYEQVPVTRRYFDVGPNAPDDQMMQEALRHPVFEIDDPTTGGSTELERGRGAPR